MGTSRPSADLTAAACRPQTRPRPAVPTRGIRFARSRQRGGVFTFLLFILLLLSTALMYYYFQKSQRLENELTRLRPQSQHSALDKETANTSADSIPGGMQQNGPLASTPTPAVPSQATQPASDAPSALTQAETARPITTHDVAREHPAAKPTSDESHAQAASSQPAPGNADAKKGIAGHRPTEEPTSARSTPSTRANDGSASVFATPNTSAQGTAPASDASGLAQPQPRTEKRTSSQPAAVPHLAPEGLPKPKRMSNDQPEELVQPIGYDPRGQASKASFTATPEPQRSKVNTIPTSTDGTEEDKESVAGLTDPTGRGAKPTASPTSGRDQSKPRQKIGSLYDVQRTGLTESSETAAPPETPSQTPVRIRLPRRSNLNPAEP
ncbi:MAG: hypothetical protein N2644_10150 [Candidatus Sumerlaea chitinivorans]|nr:hypothetical protein [Candidatus Sumerlaea chitinivorans]